MADLTKILTPIHRRMIAAAVQHIEPGLQIPSLPEPDPHTAARLMLGEQIKITLTDQTMVDIEGWFADKVEGMAGEAGINPMPHLWEKGEKYPVSKTIQIDLLDLTREMFELKGATLKKQLYQALKVKNFATLYGMDPEQSFPGLTSKSQASAEALQAMKEQWENLLNAPIPPMTFAPKTDLGHAIAYGMPPAKLAYSMPNIASANPSVVLWKGLEIAEAKVLDLAPSEGSKKGTAVIEVAFEHVDDHSEIQTHDLLTIKLLQPGLALKCAVTDIELFAQYPGKRRLFVQVLEIKPLLSFPADPPWAPGAPPDAEICWDGVHWPKAKILEWNDSSAGTPSTAQIRIRVPHNMTIKPFAPGQEVTVISAAEAMKYRLYITGVWPDSSDPHVFRLGCSIFSKTVLEGSIQALELKEALKAKPKIKNKALHLVHCMSCGHSARLMKSEMSAGCHACGDTSSFSHAQIMWPLPDCPVCGCTPRNDDGLVTCTNCHDAGLHAHHWYAPAYYQFAVNAGGYRYARQDLSLVCPSCDAPDDCLHVTPGHEAPKTPAHIIEPVYCESCDKWYEFTDCDRENKAKRQFSEGGWLIQPLPVLYTLTTGKILNESVSSKNVYILPANSVGIQVHHETAKKLTPGTLIQVVGTSKANLWTVTGKKGEVIKMRNAHPLVVDNGPPHGAVGIVRDRKMRPLIAMTAGNQHLMTQFVERLDNDPGRIHCCAFQAHSAGVEKPWTKLLRGSIRYFADKMTQYDTEEVENA